MFLIFKIIMLNKTLMYFDYTGYTCLVLRKYLYTYVLYLNICVLQQQLALKKISIFGNFFRIERFILNL